MTHAPALGVAVGRYHPGARGLERSYRDARTALSLGQRFLPRRGLYALDELGLGAWVGLVDEGTRRELAERLIAPLESSSDLLDTLEVFFAENRARSSAAAHLAIHRNSLTYRLDRVRRLTGLDPRRFDDAVQLRLALLLWRRPCADAQQRPAEPAAALGT
jgi:carbohydrate diacid regulator